MKHFVNPFAVKAFTFIFLLTGLMSLSSWAGGDTYQIYLNNKLIMKQYVGTPTNGLLTLPLESANPTDQVVVYYSHCGVVGKGRNITVKDQDDKIVKEWKFADATGSDASMTIPVKDLLELKKKYPDAKLSMYYASSAQMPQGRMLVSLGMESVTDTRKSAKI